MQINQPGPAQLQANKTNSKTPVLNNDAAAKRATEIEQEVEFAENTVDDKVSLSEQSLQRAKSDVDGSEFDMPAIADREQAENAVARLMQGIKNDPGAALAMYRTMAPETVELLMA